MAFDANKYKGSTEERYMPVVLLLDVSGSMDGDKIENLYEATVKMIETFAAESKKEIPYKIAIITFGDGVNLHTPYTDATTDFARNLSRFYADGWTPLGAALNMSKNMIEDADITKRKWYRPAVVLVSDGYPNDDWEIPLRDFISTGRTERCQRLSMGIGDDADFDMLRDFASEDTERISGTDKLCFKADAADDIVKVFKLISLSISTSATQSKKASTGATTVSRRRVVDDDDE